MFSRGLSVAIPTVAAPPKILFPQESSPRHPYEDSLRKPRARCIFSVGITAFNPRLQVRSSLSGMHTIICTHALRTRRTQRRRASTRPYTACIYHHRQRPIHHRNASPRSCRGDWEVARNTRIAYMQSIPIRDNPCLAVG